MQAEFGKFYLLMATKAVSLEAAMGRDFVKIRPDGLSRLRKRRYWNQKTLAEKLGVDSETISRIERSRGPAQIELEFFPELAKAFELSIEDAEKELLPPEEPPAPLLPNRMLALKLKTLISPSGTISDEELINLAWQAAIQSGEDVKASAAYTDRKNKPK